MYLFIFESIGTSELLLIGIVALIFLGPRRMPEMARKIGKMMADFRNTTTEFKETWQREVNFEEEKKALTLDDIDAGTPATVEPAPVSASEPETITPLTEPAIREIDPASLELPVQIKETGPEKAPTAVDPLDKQNWL